MNKGLKRFLSAVLSMAMIFSSITFANITSVMAGNSYISEEGAWLESAYVEWTSVPNATGFAAYVKKAGDADSSYVKLDNELIRKYPTYFRADAVGLAAGQYVMKIVPYINNQLDESAAFVSGTLDVKAQDRSGSAFSSQSPFYGKGVGAYNNDGTLKSDAKVLYVTSDTAKTVTADIIVDSKGTKKTVTGMQEIITAKQKGYDKTPLDFRIIGTIEKSDMDSLGSSAEGLQIKGKNAGAELNITIEGVGEDAGIRGFGILCRNAGNIELSNFAIMLCMDDCVSIDTDNNTLWIHNLDLFYGNAGGDSDQAKGDGTIDVKGQSNYVTVAYNHFWDSGKSSLCGMSGESTSSHITYHHNWFDHSDSRHPRIRVQSVHIYNNYFDGNSKYGVGVTLGSSAFVESNYFRNCKHPMMSSLQGSDIMENEKTGVPDFSGDGTFSNEAGGVIKAYNNHIEGSDSDKFNGGVEPVYYDATKTETNGKATQYDAYLVSSRTEKVPATVKSLVGGNTYNNFDTDSSQFDLGVAESAITPVEDVPSVVTKYAGRINGGDFPADKNTFPGLTDDTSYDVDTALKSAITNYTSSLVSVGGITSGGTVDTTASTESTTEVTTKEGDTEVTTEATETTTEKVTETTTANSTPVDLGEAVTNSGSGISVVYNQATDSWDLTDSSTSLAAELNIPFAAPITSGKVVIKGTATPSSASGKWAFVKVTGAEGADGKATEVVALATNDKKNLTLRTDGANYSTSSVAISAGKTYNYEFVIDMDAKTVTLTVDGNVYTGTTTATEISGFASITSVSGSRNVTVSVPYVGILDDSPVVPTTEATTEATTAATTEATTEATTAATTEVTTETSSETTTEEIPVPGIVYGDVDSNGELQINDAAVLIDQIRNGSVGVIAGINDVTADGNVDTADVATILQKILNGTFKMPCEPDAPETTETTTKEVTTEATTVTTTEATTEATTVITTEAATEATTVITTEAATEATTVITTEATTEATTVITTEATTEVTTDETVEDQTSGDFYSFDNNPPVTQDGTTGITYAVTTKTGQVSDGLTAVASIVNGALFLNDLSATDTVKATLPLTEKTSGKVIYTAKITPSVASSNWTMVQLNGLLADGTTVGEVLGVRTDANKTYGIRVNAGKDITTSGVASGVGVAATVVITVDFDNDTAELSVDGSAPVTVTGVDAKSITSMAFQTATAERTLYVDDAGITDKSVEVTTEATTAATDESTTSAESTEGTTAELPAGAVVHNFTTDGMDSTFFTITGKLASDKGTVNYLGLVLTQCLKMETSTSITFNAPSAGTLTLVFNAANAKHNCKVDGVKYDSDVNGIVTVELEAGAHTISKRDSSNLYYMTFVAK